MFLAYNEGLENVRGAMYLQSLTSVGCFVVALFAAVILLYANSFVMKRRQKELGLYNILGLEKRHIALVMCWETLLCAAAVIAGGILAGILLSKLMLLVVLKMSHLPVLFGFSVSLPGICETAVLFAALMALTLLRNLLRLYRSKPVELLHSEHAGEREPRTKWLLVLTGTVTLLGGYGLSFTVKNPVEAMFFFLLAVALVMIGTYCLFTAGSIALLKRLRANKRFYYRTNHFTAVSGLLYRMKQNAVGLANICILCTMVMVMLSGTLSLYLGTANAVHEQYPGDVNISVSYFPQPAAGEEDWRPFDPDAMLAAQTGFIESQGFHVENVRTSCRMGFGAGKVSDGVYTTDRFNDAAKGGIVMITVITEANYTATTGETLGLAPGEVAAYGVRGDTLTIRWTVDSVGTELGESSFPIAKHLSRNPAFDPQITELVTIVVPDDAAINDIWAKQAEVYPDDYSSMQWFSYLDVNAAEEELEELQTRYYDAIEDGSFYEGTGSWKRCIWNLRSEGEADAYGLAGGFLFLGLFLGFIFLLATVLMIYYKQISEGYEDKDRFEIMQKVGLSRGEVKRSIHSQILMVFFLPIVVASIHIAFDFNMVEKLLTLFYIHNTLGTVLVFFIAYGVVYALTARTYYKIVER